MTHEEFLKIYPGLIKNYQPSPEVLEHISNITMLMTIGPSGVGKTTIMKELGLTYVPADITRPQRPEEIEGVDYHFRNDYERVIQQIKDKQFVQVAIGPGGDFYSTIAGSYPEKGTAVMAVVADVVPVFRNLGFKKTISAFITPPSYAEWIHRMRSHNIVGEQLTKRLAEARRSFKFALTDTQVNFVLNDQVPKAVEQVRGILKGKIDEKREKLARKIASGLLSAIDGHIDEQK